MIDLFCGHIALLAVAAHGGTIVRNDPLFLELTTRPTTHEIVFAAIDIGRYAPSEEAARRLALAMCRRRFGRG